MYIEIEFFHSLYTKIIGFHGCLMLFLWCGWTHKFKSSMNKRNWNTTMTLSPHEIKPWRYYILHKSEHHAILRIWFKILTHVYKLLFMTLRLITYVWCYFSWIPTCAKVFLEKNELWQDLVPPGADDSTELVEEFFACVAALMSIQLRSMVINSLADFLAFFAIHKVSLTCWFKWS